MSLKYVSFRALLLREVVPPTQVRSGTAVVMPRINFHFLKVMMNSDTAAWGGGLPPNPEVIEDKMDEDTLEDSAAWNSVNLAGISPSFKACPFESARKGTKFVAPSVILLDSTS